MGDTFHFKFTNQKAFEERFGKIRVQQVTNNAVRNHIRDMQETMKEVTPLGTKYRNDRSPGNLKQGWVRPVHGKPTYRITNKKDGTVNVFLYNHAQDKFGHEYGNDVNYGHESYNQFGGAYVTKYGTTFVPGKFFIEAGMNRLENDRELTDDIEEDITRGLNS